VEVCAPPRARSSVSVIFVASPALWRPISATCLPARAVSSAASAMRSRSCTHAAEFWTTWQVAADPLDELRGAVQRATRVLYRLADVARFAAARFGKLVNFVCHDGEAASVNTGARRFNRGVEGEEVRLVRHETDRL